MKTELELLKERVEIYLKDVHTREKAVEILKKTGIKFTDDSDEYGYTNIHFYRKDGAVRAYIRPREKNFIVKIMSKVEFYYSGIPTFEPSGKKSF